MLATKCVNLSLIPETHVEERENFQKLFSDLQHRHCRMHEPVLTHTHTQIKDLSVESLYCSKDLNCLRKARE